MEHYEDDYDHDQEQEEEEEDLEDGKLRREDDGTSDEEGDHNPQTARERKKAALYPPIASICAAMGGFEEFKTLDGEIETAYSLGDQVVGCLKDLKRFWRMDEKDDDRTVARIFYEVGVLKGDLLPILLSTLGTGPKGDRIALACVELVGAMTWPINVIEELKEAQSADELKSPMDYHALLDAQRSYKFAILRAGALRAMFQLMTPSLTKSRRERTTKDESIISLVLHVFRNLAALKDPPSASTSADAIEFSNLQSEYIQQLTDEHIFDLLIAIAHNAESSEYAPWNFIALDIFHLIFRGVKPSELMIPANKVDESRLKTLLDLEGSKRKAASKIGTSRHSRFGTTVALQTGGRKYIMHGQSTLTIGAEKKLDEIKKTKAQKIRKNDDLQPPSHLRPNAIRCLQKVATSFIDSAFNPFFASILKDIRMERDKVKESDTVRFLFLSRFFMEFFLLLYKEENEKGVDPESEEGHNFELIAEMTEPGSIGFVTQRMKIALEEKPVPWTELHASIDCFIQMLLVIEALSASGVDDNIDVSEILQNKLYYEAETLDMVLTVISKYNGQSIKYLDSIINLSYVLLRMLEKYSKSKSYMYVRKKKKNKGRKKKGNGEHEGDGIGQGDDEEDEVDRGSLSYGEHTFEFQKFEQKFADEPILATCMIYLEGYKNFTDPEQLKRIVSLMHRQAIKAKSEGLFFKPTVLELFKRILEDSTITSSRDQGAVDLKKLIEYILKKFFKSAKDNPLLIVEIFFAKSKSQLGKMRTGVQDPYGTSDDEGPSVLAAKKIAEVEVTPGFSLTQQIGIAVAVLVDDDKQHLVELIQDQLALASAARTEISLTTDGDSAPIDGDDESDEALRRKVTRLQGPSKEAIALFTPHAVAFASDEDRRAAWSDSHFKLLMRLLKWESTEVPDSLELTWTIPTSLIPSTLDGDIRIINGFLLDPVDPNNGKSAADLLRKKRKAPNRRKRRAATEEEGDLDGEDEAPKKRQKKRKAEVENFKSAQFIEDSDDEDNEERDRAFFAAEQALRDQLNAGAIKAAATAGTKKKKEKAPAKGKKAATIRGKPGAPVQITVKGPDLVSDLSDMDDEPAAVSTPSERGSSAERPTSTSSSGGTRKRAQSVTSVSSGAGMGKNVEESEEDEPIQKAPKKRRVVVDSDSE